MRSQASPIMRDGNIPLPKSLEALREAARTCQRCPLWKHATQTVFGEGPKDARLLIVGEQPGDKEDLQGHPFVGPAGLLLDKALGEVGIDRRRVYVTNAVKHFKFEPRGKRRMHKTPTTTEIKACRFWLEGEFALLEPKLVLALGATALHGLLGHVARIGEMRGEPIPFGDNAKLLVTTHPSAILRMKEPMRAQNYADFLNDLKRIPALLEE
ncbi:UdgX family uracil-DNA binding protein [Beijerinckia indica]|uniref:Type-4 uracil-DNA glycosylase n=1 Tax=Beijerinckia indica subsp. indica (strain ATCC 9039 / DSM 1715 / NCIMB 8712) TaxID=395963 RepID=B2IDW2_BEII9|nr:UdgX family uracil-DNA binding protein [Beijerinckia indica]ACB96894.1 phage SPO1 DNA polymerase-related protein [Beijerinckia indica subsp. indica ATCC 9039]